MYEIIQKEILNDVVDKMVIKAPYVARKCEPGQFIIIRVDEKGERIPLTIADYDRQAQTVTIIYQKVGNETKKLSELEVGDSVEDFVGPLGMPTVLHQGTNHVVGIAGGVGAAPLYPQLKKMKEMGAQVDVIIGGRSADLVLLKKEYEAFCDKVYVATNDGSLGVKGFVTDVLRELMDTDDSLDEVIAIGPVVMMKAVVDLTKPVGLKTNVSLNPIMIDGTGMCGGCRVTIAGETKFACVDGPDFDGFDVDFDELIRRQIYYKKAEEHVCQVTGETHE